MLTTMMETHCGPRNMPIIDAMTKLEGHKADLGEQVFALLMNQLKNDVNAWRVHRHTCSDYNGAVFKMKLTWNLKRHEHSGKAADAFLKQHCLVLVLRQGPRGVSCAVLAAAAIYRLITSDPRRARVHLCLV